MARKGALRVGVIGCGGIAQMMHLPTLAERPDLFTIAGLSDVSEPTLAAVGARYGVQVLETDYRTLLARDDIDAFLLLSSGSHLEAATAVLEAGKHLFTEKPLGFSAGETEAIAAVAKRSPGTLMVGYHKRYDPAYRRAREAVSELGGVRYVEALVLHPDDAAYRTHHAILPAPAAPARLASEEEWRRAVFQAVDGPPMRPFIDETVGSSAGAAVRVACFILFQSIVHQINALRGVLGDPVAVESAHVWQDGFAQSSLSRFADDVRAAITWVSLPGLKHYEETIRFVGPRGRVTLVFPSPYLRHMPTPLSIERMDGDDLVIESRTVSYEEAFRAELYELRRCIVEGDRPETDSDDAIGDAKWITAIARALTIAGAS